jgi:hypothetical protein
VAETLVKPVLEVIVGKIAESWLGKRGEAPSAPTPVTSGEAIQTRTKSRAPDGEKVTTHPFFGLPVPLLLPRVPI